MDTPNVVGLAGVTVALGATVANFWHGIQDRRQQRKLLVEAKLLDWRRDVYVDILTYVERVLTFAQRTAPILTPSPDPPEWPSEETIFTLNARTAALASAVVKKHLDAFASTLRSFHATVREYNRLKQEPESRQVTFRVSNSLQRVEDVRQNLGEVGERLSSAISHELSNSKSMLA